MNRVTVEFETITPLFTGDTWGSCAELKPSSIMGSLRFWFEVYCHFAGIDVKEKEELKDIDYQKILQNLKKDIDDIDKYIFDRLPLTLSSKIFGCTGWKSRIEIESIRYLDDYCFGNRLNLPSKIIPSKNWFFAKPYFFGKFQITFKTTEEIKSNILFPLLNFIQKYGFIGAKNNIGYGRIKVLNPEVSKLNIIKISKFLKENKDIKEEIFKEKDLSQNLNGLDYSRIEIFKTDIHSNDLESIIKKLISKKAELRRQENNKYIRHYKFGSIAKDIYKNEEHNIEIKGPNATKIIPLIEKENDKYIGKFLSIWGIQNFGDKR